ncbi:TolC family outer membrane protein [Pelagibaculum spongiae]|uniref:Type I secretion protein TolC n=1 Tax=Pelagibaculum spongiae TaxID=2080658 RepID=A0A2V1GXY4_9GAMM|nr:TolC family outer membrane protein [Pelagibaculum spongiae]PVZ70197.1 hypothetical protein DC094_06230 [Pelagibaculum spongiae]
MIKQILSSGALCLALVSMPLTLQAANNEDLLSIFSQAQQNDPQLRSSEINKELEAENINLSKAQFLPTLGASASASRQETDGSGGEIIPTANLDPSDSFQQGVASYINGLGAGSREVDTQSYGLSLRQSIYNHANYVTLDQARLRQQQANIQYQSDWQQLAIRTASAYFGVLQEQVNLTTTKAQLEATEQQLEEIEQRFKVGLIAITDLEEAKARYDLVTAQQIAAEAALDNSKEALREITGKTPSDLADTIEEMPLDAPAFSAANDWVLKATQNNTQLKAARKGLDVARKEIARTRTGHLPTLDFSASYQKTQGDSENDVTAYGLSLNIPIYAGGAVSTQTRQAALRFDQARQQYEQSYRQLERNTRETFRNLISSVAQIKALKQAVRSSESALEATQAGFNVGTRTVVEVLNAQTSLYSARRDYAQARYGYLLNRLQLEFTVGDLTEQDIKQTNSWLK